MRWTGPFGLAALALLFWTGGAPGIPGDDPPYVIRGHAVESRQRAFDQRLQRFHRALADRLRHAAPDLLPGLEPPPEKVSGYRILPRLIPDVAPQPPSPPRVVRFSWRWSDTLIAREMATLDRLEADLARIEPASESADRSAYLKLVSDYQTVIAHRRTINADIDYNWLWQARIARDRPLFDRLTARLNAVVERQTRGESLAELAIPAIGFDPPAFVRIDPPADHRRTIMVPFYTDIEDTAFVAAFTNAVEDQWRVRNGAEEARVKLTMKVIPPDPRYARGEKVDLARHVARSPDDGAVLTTGAASLQTSGTRAIVLGPHDVAPRVLAHEFGHVMGFPDGYLRGYQDLGPDGFQVLELVPDASDIMSSPGYGSVLAWHVEGLIAAKEIQTRMQAGLEALYQRRDPEDAIAQFRRVLGQNPHHYGATLQLAKALDRAGWPDSALAMWKRMLPMAEAAHDAETIKTVRSRLGQSVPTP